MAKLDKGYESYFNYLRRKISIINTLYLKYFADENRISVFLNADQYYVLHDMEPITGFKAYLVGPFQTFLDMWKDAADTIKPYKGGYQIIRDALQPVYGLGNVIKGVLYTVAAPLTFLVNFFLVEPYRIIYSLTHTNASFKTVMAQFLENMKINLIRTPSWMLDGVLNIVRGITQIATTPFSWAKMVIRAGITAHYGWPKIEENPGIQQLVKQGYEVLENNENFSGCSMDRITNALHSKFTKTLSKGQVTDIATEDEQEKYGDRWGFEYYTSRYGRSTLIEPMSEKKVAHAKKYLGLFSTNQNKQSEREAPSLEENISTI